MLNGWWGTALSRCFAAERVHRTVFCIGDQRSSWGGPCEQSALFPKGNKICDMQTCLSRLPQKQDWGVRRTWKTRPVLKKLCWNGLQCLHEGGGARSSAVKYQLILATTKCWYSQSLHVLGRCCASTRRSLFQLGRDFRTSKFFAVSDIGGSSKIAKISIIQELEGPVWDLEVWIESAVARQSIFTLLGFESLQSHWPTFVWASFHRFGPFKEVTSSTLKNSI